MTLLLNIIRFGLASLLAVAAASSSRADPVEDFYRGKSVSLIISTPAGSSYDLMGRVIARYLGKYLPGNPSIVVRNQPGAGGIAAANMLFNTAPKDGTVIAGLQGSVPFEPLLGTKEAIFDPLAFNWLGSPSSELCVLTVWADSAAKTFADVQEREITVGSSGVNSNPSFSARLLNQVLGTKLRLVYGYPGQPDVFHAMERGEVDGHPCVFWSALVSTRPSWLAEKKVNLLLQYGPAKEPDLGDTPFAMNLVKDPEDKLLLDAAFAPLALGRPYLMPPGVPADRVDAMQRAMMSVYADEDFVAEANRLKLSINAPRSGSDIHALVKRTYAMPQTILGRLRSLSQQ